MKDVLLCVQSASTLTPMTVLGATGTPTVGEGSSFATVADTGVGIYTVTFSRAWARAPIVIATAVQNATSQALTVNLRSVSETSFILEVADDASAFVDADVHLLIWGTDRAQER